jgi:hypothetical protein
MNKMENVMDSVRVKTKIVYEVEYPLNLEFYGNGQKEEALAMEREIITEDPATILDSFGSSGKTTVTVKEVG